MLIEIEKLRSVVSLWNRPLICLIQVIFQGSQCFFQSKRKVPNKNLSKNSKMYGILIKTFLNKLITTLKVLETRSFFNYQ